MASVALAPLANAQVVYVPNSTSHSVTGYLVNPITGMLGESIVAPVSTGITPTQVLVHPSGRFLYVLNEGSQNVTVFSISAPSGALTTIADPIYAATTPSGMAMDPAGQYLFVTNGAMDTVTPYLINAVTGGLTPRSPVSTAGTRPVRPAVDRAGRFLYVPNSGSGKVAAFVIGGGGFLTAVPGMPFPAGSGPSSVAASANNVFVTNQNSGDVSAYQIGSDGTLYSLGPAIAVGGNPTSVAVDPTGNFVYVANQVQIVAMNMTPSSGLPVTVLRAYNTGTRPYGVTVDQEGTFVYVSNFTSNDIAGFAISAGGTLIPLGLASVFGGFGPQYLTVHHIGDATAIVRAPGFPSPAGPTQFGTPVEIKGIVRNTSNPGIAVRGSVSLFVNGIPVPNGTAVLDASGSFDLFFNLSTQFLPVGNNLIEVKCSPAPGFETPGALQLAYSVGKATPNFAFTWSPANPVAGQSTPFSVSAPAVGGRYPTGTIVFKVDNVATGGALTLSGGSATAPLIPTSGDHTITIEYSGDGYFAQTTRSATYHGVNQTTTTMSSSSASLVYGQTATLTASVSAGGSVVTGPVDFYDGAVKIGTASLTPAGGSYSAVLSSFRFTSPGTHTLTAVYLGDANNLASNSNGAPLAVTVNRAAASVASPTVTGTPRYGQTLTLTTTVTAAAPGSGNPTGTVIFKDGAATLATVALVNGSATHTVATLIAGSHTITASYSGDTNFLSGDSASGATVTIAQETPNVVLVTTPASGATYGQQVNLTATVGGTPGATGTVDFSVNGTSVGTAPLAGGVATLPYRCAASGTQSFSAAYTGDANNKPNTGTATLAVGKGNVEVAKPSIQGPLTTGQSITLLALVTAAAPSSGTPGGTVTFQDGSTVLGTATLAGGSASVTVSSLSAGVHSLTVTYSGDANFNAGISAAGPVTIGKATAALAVAATPASGLVSGQSITLSATFASVTPTPTGTVDFFDNGVKLNSSPVLVSGGQAQFGPFTVRTAGTHAITAVYSGDATYAVADNQSAPLGISVNKAAVSIAAPVVPASATALQPVTISVSLSAAAPGSGTPTGTVTFKDGTTTLGTATLAGGAASFTAAAVNAGTRSITATYNGDGNFLGSGSAAVTLEVAKATATVTISATPASGLISGQSIVLRATVSAASVTGTVDFYDKGVRINAEPVALASGAAQLTYSVGPAGQHAITAAYSGDANYTSINTNSAPVNLTVGQASASISMPTLTAAPAMGQPLTLTAVVTAVAPGTGTPTGSVTFQEGGRTLGSAVVSAGAASVTIPSLGAGEHAITAVYSGDTEFAGATSAALTFAYAKGLTTTTLSVSQTPTSVILTVVVSDLSGTAAPQGTVQFMNGSLLIGTAQVNPAAGATGIASLNVGSITGIFTALYTGDSNFSSSLSVPVNVAPLAKPTTSLTLKATPNPAQAGQPVTLTASFSWSGTANPSGQIRFMEGSALLGTVAATNDASLTTILSEGSHLILASYSGDATYPAASSTYTVVVNKNAGAAIQLTSNMAAAVFGQTITLTAKVSGQTATLGAPTGRVQFLTGSTFLGNGELVSGVATFQLSNAAPGVNRFTAVYSGDGNWLSSSSSISVTVLKAVTQMSICAAVRAEGSGGISVSATVAVMAPGAGVPGGSVQFVDSATGRILATAPVVGGSATATIAVENSNSTIGAVYLGDAGFLASSSVPTTQFSVLNAASYANTSLSPDEIATVFGPALAKETETSPLPLVRTLGGLTVTLADSAGVERQTLLFYVSPTQISFLVPAETAEGPATLKISTPNGLLTAAVTVAATSPGLFSAAATGQGPAAAQIIRVHADGTQEAPQNTANYDSASQSWTATAIEGGNASDQLYLVLYGTGIRHGASGVTVTLNDQAVPVAFAGAQPNYAGLDQVNVLIPLSLQTPGTVRVRVAVDGRQSNTVTLLFR